MKNNKNVVVFVVIFLALAWFFAYREYNLNNLKENKTESQVPSNAQNKDGWTVCTEEYNPVCWEDNNTYSNSCIAEKQNNVKVKYEWLCKTDENNESSGILNEWQNKDEKDIWWDDCGLIWWCTSWTLSWGLNDVLTWSSLSWALDQSWSIDWEKVLNYFNSNFNYWFSVPNNSYYSWFWAKDWANHTVWINSWTWVIDFESSQVKVYFYKDKILDELMLSSNYGRYKKDNKTYLQLWNNSVVIENSWNWEKIAEMIIKTIYVK
ncbi:MAG: hypothetical protein ACD_4C00353G0001 [uncultured bacterium (gcode 4)]|uniref:Kazal-like domain-containing protein n=1 Tax=uncultured bacterium (gcode 4) TaxID=1234023 RepID=K2G851_9BACT|nr:MAG: hypothetical protein ACD_4C00353G0001 [uncultured bacterium (gcode 4)]